MAGDAFISKLNFGVLELRSLYILSVNLEVGEGDLGGSVNLVALLYAIELAILDVDILHVGGCCWKSVDEDAIFAA